MGNVARWMKYGRAWLDGFLQRGNEELDQLEAEREAEVADKPWLASTSETPTLDEVRTRIRHDAGEAPSPPEQFDRLDHRTQFDIAEQQRKADDRLAQIRDELGLGGEGPDDRA